MSIREHILKSSQVFYMLQIFSETQKECQKIFFQSRNYHSRRGLGIADIVSASLYTHHVPKM